jgi:hypothetical protein
VAFPFFGSEAERCSVYGSPPVGSDVQWEVISPVDTASLVRVDPMGKRRNRQESARVRALLAQGVEVQFDTVDEWRYYHRQV